jgi:hypothetical protein
LKDIDLVSGSVDDVDATSLLPPDADNKSEALDDDLSADFGTLAFVVGVDILRFDFVTATLSLLSLSPPAAVFVTDECAPVVVVDAAG